jgi:nucleoside-diphosphate kinase
MSTSNLTLGIIKPGAVKRAVFDEIMQMISDNGFKIIKKKILHLSIREAEKFYAVHKDRPFFSSLVEFMSSGPIIAMMLEKDNAVVDFRKLIGSTNPEEAEEGTIRKMFAKSLQHNAIHGSDSDENAAKELDFFFGED